jgi:hypothetical protein
VVYLLLGLAAGYLFWPQGIRVVVLWLALLFALMLGPYLARHGLEALNGIIGLHIHFLMMPPLVMVGYELSRVFAQNQESRLRLRKTLFWLVVLANGVIIGTKGLDKILFYASDGYATAISFQIPIPENAQNVTPVLNKREGFNGRTFTSSSARARDIFEFYDTAFSHNGFARFEEPSFDADSIIMIGEGWGKQSSFSPHIYASWTDSEQTVFIQMAGRSAEAGDYEVGQHDAAEVLEVWFSIRPFFAEYDDLIKADEAW